MSTENFKTDTNVVALRGLATVTLWADDVPAARAWYADVLGIEPYFQRPDAEIPAYVEFRLGDHQDELGIIDRRYAPPGSRAQPGGAVVHWHVDDVEATVTALEAKGATVYMPLTVREAGFVTAAVQDPFGNIIGLMYNPNWLQHSAGHE
jgi:predicted enzyme related to lactoylglutathione lyase